MGNKDQIVIKYREIPDDSYISPIQLKENLDKMKKELAYMKSINNYFRTHGTVLGYPGISQSEAIQIDKAITHTVLGEIIPFSSLQIYKLKKAIRQAEKQLLIMEPSAKRNGWER